MSAAIVISGDVESAMLRDTERMTDELCAACRGAGRISERRQVSGVLALAIAERSTSDGLALAFDRGQKAEIRLLALDAVLDKILAQPDVRELMWFEQVKLDQQQTEDERQDRAERQEQFDRLMGRPVLPSLRRTEA